MAEAPGPGPVQAALRGVLHDANGELSVAMLELELQLERGDLDEPMREALATALEACRRSAARLREASRSLGSSGEVG